MSRLLKLTAGLLVVPVVAFAPSAMATIQSAIEGGNIYRAKNVTKNTDFVDPASADKCDVLQYKVWIHNVGPTETLNNVKVKAAFPTSVSNSNVSTVNIMGDNAHPSSTGDTATVNLSSSQKLSYVSGSTQLYDAFGNFSKDLPDGITQAGVNIGSVGVSTANKKFVYFKMKVDCPEQPKPEQPKPTPTPTPQPKPETPQVKAETSKTPEVLPSTGAGALVGIFAGASVAGAAAHAAVRRFRSEQ